MSERVKCSGQTVHKAQCKFSGIPNSPPESDMGPRLYYCRHHQSKNSIEHDNDDTNKSNVMRPRPVSTPRPSPSPTSRPSTISTSSPVSISRPRPVSVSRPHVMRPIPKRKHMIKRKLSVIKQCRSSKKVNIIIHSSTKKFVEPCSVCYDILTISTDSGLDCEHPLCLDCAKKMLSTVCPICRADITHKNSKLTFDDIDSINKRGFKHYSDQSEQRSRNLANALHNNTNRRSPTPSDYENIFQEQHPMLTLGWTADGIIFYYI